METPTQDLVELPEGKIYKDRAIYVGTFLGGPLVGGYLIAANFKTLGESDRVRNTWIITILATLVIFGVVLFIPAVAKIPPYLIPIIDASIASAITRHFQNARIKAFIAAEGQAYSWWRVIAITLIGAAVSFAVVFGILYIQQLGTAEAVLY
jgi:hypothetical protein